MVYKYADAFFGGIFCGTGLLLFSENIKYRFFENAVWDVFKGAAALALIYIGCALVMKEKNDKLNAVKFLMFALGIILIFFICGRQINVYSVF